MIVCAVGGQGKSFPCHPTTTDVAHEPVPYLLARIAPPPERARRRSAIANLAQIWPGSEDIWGQVIPALASVLRFDPALEVRRQAAWAIMEIGRPADQAVTALIEAARDSDEVIRWYAIVALHHLGPSAAPALPALIEALGETNCRLRGWAAEAIAALGQDAIIAPLEAAGWPSETWPEALGSAGPHVRVLIALALGTRGKDGAAALTDLLDDADPGVRRAAAAALVSLVGDAGRAIDRAVGHPDPSVRLFATVALGHWGPKAEHPLRVLMADADPDVRYTAGWSLSRTWT